MYHLFVYVPIEASGLVKSALFEAGAGKYENYDQCCWESLGAGQFRPLLGSNPYLGSENKLEKVSEVKLELICKRESIKQVLEVLKQIHPYEEPAYGVIEIKCLEDFK